jgi:transposase
MSDLAKSVTLQEQRSFLKIHYLLGTAKYQVESWLKRAVGNNAMKRRTIDEWYEMFESGRTKTEDEVRSGRPKTATDDQHKDQMWQLLAESRSWTTIELAGILEVSKESARKILKDDFGMHKVCAKWVPRDLTPEQRWVREMTADSLLSRFKTDPSMLDCVLAIDETWFRCYEPRKKQQDLEWHRHGEARYVYYPTLQNI